MTKFAILLFLSGTVLLSQGGSLDHILAGQEWETGYVNAGKPGNDLFYFLVKAASHNSSAPIIIWLNGGPGCSSMYGLFAENGPLIIDRDLLVFKQNLYSWNTFADMLYLDQPFGVGFSRVRDVLSLCEDEMCVAKAFYQFLLTFLEKHPEYIGRDLYLAGESYSGHYIPAIGKYLFKARNAWINFKGMALGNSFVRLPIQVQAYPLFLLENEIFSFIDYIAARVMNLICFTAEYFELPSIYILGVCDITFGGQKSRIVNPYDIRENTTYDEMDKTVEIMLRKKEVQDLLGVNVPDFTICNETVMMKFLYDISKSYSQDVELLLENGINVMMFFGNKDYVCNWRGGESLVDSFNWAGKREFVNSQTEFWFNNGTRSGTYRKYKNLNFVVVFDAGHMVPLNQPIASLAMMRRFIYGDF